MWLNEKWQSSQWQSEQRERMCDWMISQWDMLSVIVCETCFQSSEWDMFSVILSETCFQSYWARCVFKDAKPEPVHGRELRHRLAETVNRLTVYLTLEWMRDMFLSECQLGVCAIGCLCVPGAGETGLVSSFGCVLGVCIVWRKAIMSASASSSAESYPVSHNRVNIEHSNICHWN